MRNTWNAGMVPSIPSCPAPTHTIMPWPVAVGPHSLPFLKELASGTAVWGGEDSPIPDAAAVSCGTKREMLWQSGEQWVVLHCVV